MPEALARVRHDGVISAPARGARKKSRVALPLRLLRGALRARPRDWAGAVLAAGMAGIVVNAVMLQRARHPSPFFAASPPSAAATRSPPAGPIPPSPVAAPPVAATPGPPAPPPRPADLAGANETVATPRATDPITDMLRSEANRESQRLLATAQSALAKLGYPVRIGGGMNAETAAALREFEKTHGLPISTEITPRLVRSLNAAANSAASR